MLNRLSGWHQSANHKWLLWKFRFRRSLDEIRRVIEREGRPAVPPADARVQAPIGSQEVWAAGVTYERSLAVWNDSAEQSDVLRIRSDLAQNAEKRAIDPARKLI